LAQLLRPHRARLGVAGACVVASSAAALALPDLVGRGIDTGVIARQRGQLLTAVVLFLVLAFAGAVAEGAAERISGRVAELATFDLRLRLWRHIQTLSLDFFERTGSGEIIATATSDVDAVHELLSAAALTLASNCLLLVGIVVAMFVLDPVLAAIGMALSPAVVGATLLFNVRSEVAYRSVREKVALVMTQLAETLGGLKVIQAFSREEPNQDAFDRLNHEHLFATNRTVRVLSAYGPTIDVIGQSALFLVVVIGAFRAIAGQVTVGVLTAFTLYLRQFFGPLQDLAQFHNTLRAANAGLDRITATFAVLPKVQEAPTPRPLTAGGGEVRLEGVTFAYGHVPVVQNVDLLVRPGEILALVGRTGAGKSTIAKLVARLHDPQAGRIVIDGQDVRDISLSSLRDAVVLLPQESFLFKGTVRENIALGISGTTDEDIDQAASAVGLQAIIAALPHGYETMVAERGVGLSAAERQLVSFARVWLLRPKVLILDEPTSALDARGERLVRTALISLLRGRTSILVSHRAASVELADRVAVIERGRVVDVGTRTQVACWPSPLGAARLDPDQPAPR
jgi:ABC-type multidrug transport system fused ATPase/permease subunit